MRRNRRVLSIRPGENHRKEIRFASDFQLNWATVIPELTDYELQRVDFLSIAGDAPKDFITDSEYRPGHRTRRQRRDGYIAKVGSKFYPNESITEQLITRIGEIYEMRIAQSKLRLIDGQVRFMSKYFLDRRFEQLTHGAEIYELCLGKENYAEIAEKRSERDFFTFQMTREAIEHAFPGYTERVVQGYVEMLTFDALIGHNDRHPYNWGVVVSIRKGAAPRFSPVYDTARALMWNLAEPRVRQMLTDGHELEKYVDNCLPPVGWDKEPNVDFFRLIGLIWQDFVQYRNNIAKFLSHDSLKLACQMVEGEFKGLLSAERRAPRATCEVSADQGATPTRSCFIIPRRGGTIKCRLEKSWKELRRGLALRTA